MTDKNIENRRPVGSDCFVIIYSRRSNNNLQYFLDRFNVDDYYIYKSSGNQKEVTYQEFLEFKYAGYILFKKSSYIKEHIDIWIKFIIYIGSIQFINKKLPPFLPEEKIEIRK